MRDKWKYLPAYKSFGSSSIELSNKEAVSNNVENKKLLDLILENYIDFPAHTLSAMTHGESPWKNTPKNEIISNTQIVDYYSSQWFAKNFPLSDDSLFYPVISDTESSFIFDMNLDDAKETMTFPSYKVYKEMKKEAQKQFQMSKSEWIKSIANAS